MIRSNKEGQKRNDHASNRRQNKKRGVEKDKFNDGFESSLLIKVSHRLIQVKEKYCKKNPGEPISMHYSANYHKNKQKQKENGLNVKNKNQVFCIIVFAAFTLIRLSSLRICRCV